MTFNTANLVRLLELLKESALLKPDFHNLSTASQVILVEIFALRWDETQDTIFKLLRKALRSHGHGARRIDQLHDKDLLRLSNTHGLISAEALPRWFAQRDLAADQERIESPLFKAQLLALAPAFIADTTDLERALQARFSLTPELPIGQAPIPASDLHLSPEILARLKELLAEHAPELEFLAYGSRVNGGGHDGGDIDLVVRNPKSEDRTRSEARTDVEDLKLELSKSDLPVRVDLLEWSFIPEAFREEISRKHAVIQEGLPKRRFHSTP